MRQRLAVVLIALLVSSGCVLGLYPPWTRPPEVRQAPLPEAQVLVVKPVSETAKAQPSPGATTLMARAMLDAGIEPDRVMAALLKAGLDDAQAIGALNAALSTRGELR
jgi:hypothetical protein